MALLCKKCNESIIKRDYIVCCDCGNEYHLDCTSISKKLFYLMASASKKKCKCDECKYIDESTNKNVINVPTTNSFECLPDESDEDISGRNEYVTLRKKKQHNISLPDITASFISTSEMNESGRLNRTSHSNPDRNNGNYLLIEELKSEIEMLRRELDIAHNEVDDLMITNQELLKKTKKQENIIKLYKTVSTDDLIISNKSIRSYISTPISTRNKTSRKCEKFITSTCVKNKLKLELDKPQDSNDWPSTTAARDKTSWKPKSTTKVCLISNINSRRKKNILRQQLEDFQVCHYLMPGAGIEHLLNGIETKLESFTSTDYCVIMMGESDFFVSKNYNSVVNNIRQKLKDVQHTNIIFCLPTFRYLCDANIYNARLEIFNKLLYYNNLEHEYCYILDSNLNLSYSLDMFSNYTGKINNIAFKKIVSDLNMLMLCINDMVVCYTQKQSNSDFNNVSQSKTPHKKYNHSFRG